MRIGLSARIQLMIVPVMALLGMVARPAAAAPAYDQLKPDKGYGVVSAKLLPNTPSPGFCTYQITVTNLSGSADRRGIKGLLVYSPVAPVSMNDRPRTVEHLYQAEHQYTWWDINGAPDRGTPNPKDKLLIESGESDSNFFLTFKEDNCPDACKLRFGLHVVGPGHNGGAFFQAGGQPLPCNCAKLSGKVKCPDGHLVAGAKVELLQGSTVVATATTNAAGEFSFDDPANGTYTIRVSAKDFETVVSAPFNYRCVGGDVVVDVVLKPLAINLNCQECLKGKVFFGVSSGYVRRATTGLTLTQADLYNPAYASPNLTTSYKYVGFIPNFPELGHFGGAGEPVVYVIVQEPLLGEDVFNNCSFSNQIGVAGALGAHPLSSNPSTFTYRSLFSLPNLGPGTAHMFTYTGIELIPNPLATPAGSFSVLPAVQISGSPAPAPAAGDLPPGWMAKARIQFQLPQASTTVVYMNGTYQDACGDMFMFHCHPDMGGGVGD